MSNDVRTHHCKVCDQELSWSAFYLRPDGRPKRRKCKRCEVAWQMERNKTAGYIRSPEAIVRRKAAGALRLAAWDRLHPEKVKRARSAAAKRFWERSPERVLEANAARRSQQRKATLPGHKEWLLAIYRTAKDLGVTVDHVEPLRGKDRCGLHVPWNLQLLSKSRNSSKRHFVQERTRQCLSI
jgi:hypothetical protein